MSSPSLTAYSAYRLAFVRDYDGPYAIQHPGRPWSTRDKPVSDPLIRAHLNQQYWLALPACWYPHHATLDFDHPGPETIDLVCDRLGLREGQYLLCTSPSWKASGALHLMMAPRYRDEPMTKRLLLTILRPLAAELGIEVYPQLRRKFRLPFGKDQDILDPETRQPLSMSWEQELYWAEKLDPFELSTIPHRPASVPVLAPPVHTRALTIPETEQLWQEGLPGKGSRHDACKALAIGLYRRNHEPGEVKTSLNRWITTHHNGYSDEVNKGNWRGVHADNTSLVDWVFTQYHQTQYWPDSTHNLEGWITPNDLRFIVAVYPGDLVNQRRLFKLLLYYRPRSHHPWVYISARQWKTIAHAGLYTGFRADLAQRGLLDNLPVYHPGGYPKRIRLNRLPSAIRDQALQQDHRMIQNYYTALRQLCGHNKILQATFTGAYRQNFYADRRTES